MSLTQLVYASTASQVLTLDEIKVIVQQAAKENLNHLISGFLCSDGKLFLQCIEGEKNELDQLYEKISTDCRHHSIEVLYYKEAKQRSFPSWNMAGVLQISRHQDILKKFNPNGDFEPYHLTGEDSLALLKEFAKLRGMIINQ